MIFVLLCAYNEEKNIVPLIDEIKKIKLPDMKIVLVNDGSTDLTRSSAETAANDIVINIIDHEKNKGLGVSLNDGFEMILPRMQKEDLIITMDADQTHPPELFKEMAVLIATGSDIVIASRYCDGGSQSGLSFFRKSASFAASLILKKLFNLKNVKDYTSGYRAYSFNILNQLKRKYGTIVKEHGFTSTAEILLKAGVLTEKINEIPLELKYEKKLGKSKMKVFITILSYFKLIYQLKNAVKNIKKPYIV
jgi:dolichol-phosphate mannosyltransferase